MSGSLIVVATPIGNLGDLSVRALDVLRSADVIYCEDTRHSRQLFSANSIASGGRLRALHEHNEAAQCDEIVARVRDGATVAIISDAGTPGVSDPGARVVAAVAEAGLRVTTTPGPSAVIAALSVSGLVMDRFVMDGFVPRKAGERSALYERWRTEERTIVFYESPQRLSATLAELALTLGERRAVVARELTKLYEEVVRARVSELADVFAAREPRGEIVVVLEGAPPMADVDTDTLVRALETELAAGASVRDAAARVADILDVARRRVYELALTIRRDEEH